jgi:hypothetical protein
MRLLPMQDQPRDLTVVLSLAFGRLPRAQVKVSPVERDDRLTGLVVMAIGGN